LSFILYQMWASLILAACVAHTVTSQCAPGFSFYQNSCYYVVATRLTWFGADKYCTTILPKNLNVRLVTVSNIGEDNFVRDLIRRDNDAKNRDNWMGLTDIDKRRGWVWAATQSSLGYSNWREGRPSSSGKCAFYSYYYNGQWYNDDCYDQRSFVCEYSLFGEKEIEEQKANELELKKNCPSGFVSFGNSCYYVIPSSLTWFQAEHYCSLMVPRTYDCHLASIESRSENDFLVNYIRGDSSYRNRQFWTSGNYMDPRKGWHWSSNQRSVSYTNWASGEPNGSGKCIQLWEGRNYQWDDATCYNTPSNHGFICEIERN